MKTQTVIIEHDILKSDEKAFVKIPLPIPDGVETICIKPGYIGDNASATVTDAEKNVIDFALADENGDDIGASGSNTREICISKSYASDGYKRLEPKGTWTIIAGCYQVKSTGTKVTYTVRFSMREKRFLKGDIHSHTTNSDGRFTPAQLAEKARKKGLDFLFITDHNNSTEDLSMPVVSGLTIIPGLELTSYDGHINLLGVKKPYDGSYAVDGVEELNEKLRQAKQRGALRFLNHPFCHMCPIKWKIEDIDFDGIEVWNGPAIAKDMKAIDWWQKKLESGERLPAIGGSDYHRDYFVTDLLASPTTHVWADGNDAQTILDAIRRGACTITKTPTSTFLDIRCGESTVGDVVCVESGKTVEVRANNMKKGHCLQIFTQQGLVYEYSHKRGRTVTHSIEITQPGFVRAQIVYHKSVLGKLLQKAVMSTLSKEEAKKPISALVWAITNPIYFE